MTTWLWGNNPAEDAKEKHERKTHLEGTQEHIKLSRRPEWKIMSDSLHSDCGCFCVKGEEEERGEIDKSSINIIKKDEGDEKIE